MSISQDERKRVVAAILAQDDLPGWVREQLAEGRGKDTPTNEPESELLVESRSFDRSYIDFLHEQRRLGARGEAWNSILDKRIESLTPWVDRDLQVATLSYGQKRFVARLVDGTRVIHWEEM